jgi:hypothetical protein
MESRGLRPQIARIFTDFSVPFIKKFSVDGLDLFKANDLTFSLFYYSGIRYAFKDHWQWC